MATDTTDDGAWHVSSVLTGMGQRPGSFVHYVQRYVRPQEGRRYTGDVATRTWADRDQAQAAADAANARPEAAPPFTFRGTYL